MRESQTLADDSQLYAGTTVLQALFQDGTTYGAPRAMQTNESATNAVMFRKAVVLPGLRGSERARFLQDTCSVDGLLEETEIDDNFTGWMEDSNGNNFVTKLLTEYLESDDKGPLARAKGSEITSTVAGNQFPDVCRSLPLDDDTCYLTQNPQSSFLEFLVAKLIPFGKEIVDAKNKAEDALREIGTTIEEAQDFLLPNQAAPGTCIVANDDMLGVSELPGFPP